MHLRKSGASCEVSSSFDLTLLMRAYTYMLCVVGTEAGGYKVTAADLASLAKRYNCVTGKWMVFVKSSEVDDAWSRVAHTVMCNPAGRFFTAKVSPRTRRLRVLAGETHTRPEEEEEEHVICAYTRDFTNEKEVMEAREELRQLGFAQTLFYKADLYTHLGIYRDNPWGIRASVYCA